MNTYEKFIVNPEGLPEVMSAILNREIPEPFNREFLMGLGIDEPNSTLYISLFQNLGMVDSKGMPTPVFERFHRSEQAARRVVADQMRNKTYSALFRDDEHVCRLPEEQVRVRFQNLMGEKKSATFVRLVTDTFLALCGFADWEQKVTPEDPAGREEPREAEAAVAMEETHPESLLSAGPNGHEVNAVTPETVSKAVLGETDLQEEKFRRVKLQEASSPHEEFILELMYDADEHPYTCHTFQLGRSADENDLVMETDMVHRNGTMHGSANGTDHGTPNGTFKGAASGAAIEHTANGSGNGTGDGYGNGTGDRSGTVIPLSNQASGTPDQKVLFLKAMVRRAALLKQMERMQEAVGAYDQIIRYFDSRCLPADRDNLINAYYNKAYLLEQMEQYEEALSIYENLIQCYSSSTN